MKLLISINGDVTEFSPDPNLGIITIGRADGNDVCLKDEKAASRQHVNLERTVDGWKMVDQMSANGTGLNGEKMNFAFLKDGDVIQVGATKIQVTGLIPTPGARSAPARSPKRADAPRIAPRRAPEGEERPVVGPVPRAKSPVPALVAAAAIILVLGAGGWFVISSLTTSPPSSDTVADTSSDAPRHAELSDDEKAALTLARDVMAGPGEAVDKMRELERIQDRLKGKRGSKALSDITDMKSELARELDRQVNTRVDQELASATLSAEEGNFALAMQKLSDLDAWLDDDAYVASMAKAHHIKIQRKRGEIEEFNRGFLALSFSQMWNYADQMRYDEALAVCDDILTRAWLTAEDRDVYETERKKISALRENFVPPEPEVKQEEEKKPSILDKVKKDESRLPGKNPLLPDGARSEAKMLAALQERLVAAVKDGSMKGKRFNIRGHDAQIEGLSGNGRLKYLYAYVDKKTGDELVVPSSAKWEDIKPEDMLNLYDVTPGLTDEDRLALVIYCYEHGFTDRASQRALLLYKSRNDWKEGIDNLVASKRKIAIPEGGFVEHDGMLVTPAEKEDAIFVANLRAVLERFEKGIGSKDRRKAEDAEAAFNELIEMGERAVKPAIEILQEVLDKEMIAAKKATGLLADDAKLKELMTELAASTPLS
jgi:pSer/pThr/pTyr-binding forkhead associated (FHA) protein